MAVKDSENENIGSGFLKIRGRDPKVSTRTVGDLAVNDAMLLVLGAWVVLFLLAYTLRHHNV